MQIEMRKGQSQSSAERRIAALVLSELLCELARESTALEAEPPLGVVLLETEAKGELSPNTKLAAVNATARSLGVRTGQTVAEACAWVAHLGIVELSSSRLEAALQGVAEALMQFAPTVSVGLPDTLWLDVTGVAHLFEGEAALLRELKSNVAALGHFSKAAIACGPLLARAFARWGTLGRGEVGVIVPNADTVRAVRQLPVCALPITAEVTQWLAQLGVLQLGDLARIPAVQLSARLGPNATLALELLQGRDRQPLRAYRPRAQLSEQVSWEEPSAHIEPLLFALRRLCARISARLEGRGEAARALSLTIHYEHAAARLAQQEPTLELQLTLASGLFRPDELQRVITTRLARVQLTAPCVGVTLVVSELGRAERHQLDLISASSKLHADPQKLNVLFSELAADLGNDRLGILRIGNSHLPEKLSLLVPPRGFSPTRAADEPQKRKRPKTSNLRLPFELELTLPHPPTRLLPRPLPIAGALRKGTLVAFGTELYSLTELKFELRLDSVEWWSGKNIARDYLRASLQNRNGQLEALLYWDRHSGESFLQGLYD